MNHVRDVAVRFTQQAIKYKIPLYLPHERLIFGATELELEVHAKIPEVVPAYDMKKVLGSKVFSISFTPPPAAAAPAREQHPALM